MIVTSFMSQWASGANPIKIFTPGFVDKNVAEVLKNALEQEGLQCLNIGLTYQADHAQSNGKIASSPLDHLCCSNDLVQRT